MTPDEAVAAVLGALDRASVPHMIVGSLASNFHGIPRSTQDADLVVELRLGALDQLIAELPPMLTLERQGGFEGVTGTTRFVISLPKSAFVCELFLLSDDPHDQARFGRRQRATLLERPAFVATAEDMIVTKLRWLAAAGRGKDREDVRNILAVRGSDLDWSYLHAWTQAHGTSDLLAEVKASLPG